LPKASFPRSLEPVRWRPVRQALAALCRSLDATGAVSGNQASIIVPRPGAETTRISPPADATR
jgi:hypothetical protein